MKKVVLILAICAILVSCNQSSTQSTQTTQDTVSVTSKPDTCNFLIVTPTDTVVDTASTVNLDDSAQ